MKKFIIILTFSFFLITNLFAEVANKIKIQGNKRISSETIKVYGNLELGKNYNEVEINKVLNNLYDTEFFQDVKVSILNNELDEVDVQNIPIFNLKVPTKVKNIPNELLDPRSTWSSKDDWNKKANELAKLFIRNFEKFCDNDHGKKLLASGPQI